MLEKLPTEILWKILDLIGDFESLKNACLVCKAWNRTVFQSAKAQENYVLRISYKADKSPAVWRTNSEMFTSLYKAMTSSERSYANIEFIRIYFRLAAKARDVLYLIIEKCQNSVKKLTFKECHGLLQNDLLYILRTATALQELNLHCEIKGSNVSEDPTVAPTLRRVSLVIKESNAFYRILPSIAPNLEELDVTSNRPDAKTRLDVAAIQSLDRQLRHLSFTAMADHQLPQMRFTSMKTLCIKVPSGVSPPLFVPMGQLSVLMLKTDMNDDLLQSIASHCRSLRELSLMSPVRYNCRKLGCLNNLRGLTKLSLRGFEAHSWNELTLSQLQYLHTEHTDKGFLEFLKCQPTLRTLKLHDKYLEPSKLEAICRLVPELELLELAFCNDIGEKDGLQHVNTLGKLRELHLLGTGVTDKSFAMLRLPSLRKLLVDFNHNLSDSSLAFISSHLPGLQSIVLNECYYISEGAIEKLKEQMPPSTNISIELESDNNDLYQRFMYFLYRRVPALDQLEDF